MFALHTKPVIHMLRTLLLLIAFSFLNVYANAHKSNDGGDVLKNVLISDPIDFQNDIHINSEILFPENAAASIAPIIILTANFPLLEMAQLSWSTSDSTIPGTYFVERKEATAVLWDELAQVAYNGSLDFTDTISYPYCTSTRLYYRIRFEATDPANNAISNEVDEFLFDQTFPEDVQNIVVSINSNSNPVITWNQILGDDISGYMICRFNGSLWPVYTTVPADSNSYTDLNADACDQSYYYVIITKDKCSRESAPLYDTNYQRTIKLDLPHIDECERLAKLSWNPYNDMPGGLGGYKIFRKINYGVPAEVTTILPSATTSYNDAYQFVNGQNYTYYIQAYSISGTVFSTSCQQTRLYSGSDVPDSVYITKVSVINDTYVHIAFHSSPDSTVKELILERSDDGGTTYSAIDSLSILGDFVPEDHFMNDTTADVHSQSYSYRLVAYDYCLTTKIYSNISKTIFLQCSSTQTENSLDWNFYESWIKEVEGYKVYRTVEGQATIDSSYLLSSINSYTDPLQGVDPTKKVCYWVVAAEKPGNPYLNDATSVSNTCCIIKGATLHMPNAFRPGGLNNRLRPITTFVDPQSFKMTIVSRWGQQLFETTDMVNGWDGVINGQLAPPGLYAYIITYKSIGGQEYTKRGTVFVLR
jgi:hypothetical protein